MQTASKPIPKFASFRSQVTTANKPIGLKGKDSLGDQSLKTKPHIDHELNNHGDVAQDEYSKQKSGRRERPSTKREILNKRHNHETATIDPWDDVPRTFIIDRYGDPANVIYGSLHRYEIPSYRRSGNGSVVGISSRCKIQRDKSSDSSLIISDNSLSRPIRRDQNVLRRVVHDPSREVSIRPNPLVSPTGDINADYVSFKSLRSKKRKVRDRGSGIDSETSTSTDETTINYRSIEGKAKPTEDPEDPDLEYTTRISVPEKQTLPLIAPDEVSRRAAAALSRKLDLDSGNGQLWIDLINCQDRCFGTGHRSRITKAERSSTAEIKLSIYDKALNKVTDEQLRERLLLGMLDEGSKVWETSKFAAKWRKVLQAHPGYVSLWVKYLDFQQTAFATFQYERFLDICKECLEVVKDAKSTVDTSPALEARYHEIQAYVLLRLTLFMREAGYSEHATAIWQSILEFNMFRPRRYRGRDGQDVWTSSPDAMKSFEDFWESEVPRIGDEDSRGWEHFDANEGLPSTPKKDSDNKFLNGTQTLEIWDQVERSQALQARRPARTIDDVEENDPYRVVMFSDVQPFLINFSSGFHSTLIYAFLIFCHLPPPPISTNLLSHWRGDAFVRNEVLRPLEGHLYNWDMFESTQDSPANDFDFKDTRSIGSKTRNNLEFPVLDFLTSSDSMFTRSWFSSFTAWKSECVDNASFVDIDYVCRILRALVNLEGAGDDFAEYFLAFEMHLRPMVVRKTAKTLLRRKPSSLRLYNAYAILEYRLGKSNVANAVMATAINMSKTLDIGTQRDAILLWKTWLWEILEHENPLQAFKLLLIFPDNEISPTLESVPGAEIKSLNHLAVLRTQRVSVLVSFLIITKIYQALSDGRDSMISLGHYYHASLYIECLVLLAYLDRELSLETAFFAFTANLALIAPRLSPTSPLPEYLHQSRVKLLNYHINHVRSCKPALIRSALSESIQLFPKNTMFLSLYSWNESRFRIDDRVRSIIQSIVLSDASSRGQESRESVVTHFFAVYTELHRGLTLGSNVHTIRRTFERAVESPVGKRSAALWKLYFLFEHSRHEAKRAKGVFYRAITACPWAKELYMLAFRYLVATLRLEELRGVYEAMVEKGLRVHVSLDDVWERLDGQDGGEGKAVSYV